MNGPEHYVEAERLLALAMESPHVHESDAVNIAAAQVHATLSHVAAQISDRYHDPTRQEFGHTDVDRAFYDATR
jgi:hypothetical protein